MSQIYGVRGLTCVQCQVSVIDHLRALPGVDGVRVDLVPFGESGVSLDRARFELVARRSQVPRPPRSPRPRTS